MDLTLTVKPTCHAQTSRIYELLAPLLFMVALLALLAFEVDKVRRSEFAARHFFRMRELERERAAGDGDDEGRALAPLRILTTACE